MVSVCRGNQLSAVEVIAVSVVGVVLYLCLTVVIIAAMYYISGMNNFTVYEKPRSDSPEDTPRNYRRPRHTRVTALRVY